MGNNGSVSDQESLPLCPKPSQGLDRFVANENANNRANTDPNGQGRSGNGLINSSNNGLNNHSSSNAFNNSSNQLNNSTNTIDGASFTASAQSLERKEYLTEISSDHRGLKRVSISHNNDGAASPRKSILRNARSEANTHHSLDPSKRWTSKISERVSDLRMRAISSDPRLSVTSYGKNEEDRISRNTASFPALMHLIRAFICCGFLSLPYAVKLAGLMVGTIIIIGSGIITSISVYLLIISAKKLQDRQRMSYLDYGQVFEAACFYGPKPFKRCKKLAKLSINIPMAIAEIGVCSAYILFVAENIQQVTETYTNYNLDIHVYIAGLVVLLLPLGSIKNPKSLTYISMAGNLVLFLGLGIIFYNISLNIGPLAELPQSDSFSKSLMCICLTLFALEGIGFVLPLEGQMEQPDDLLGWNGVLVTGSVFITMLYASLGFFGFLAYGMKIKATVTLNLPEEPLYQALKIIIAVMVLLTYTIQFYIAVDIIYWGWLAQMTEDREKRRKFEIVFRLLGVLTTACIASIVPHLAEFMSLIGAISGFPLAVIIPCVVDLLVRWPEKSLGSLGFCFWRVVLDFSIIVFGVCAMFAGTVVSVFEIIDAFKLGTP